MYLVLISAENNKKLKLEYRQPIRLVVESQNDESESRTLESDSFTLESSNLKSEYSVLDMKSGTSKLYVRVRVTEFSLNMC